MSDAEDNTFETADAGSSDVYPMQAGELRKGSHVMIKNRPCKVAEVSTSKTGKHRHAKCHIVAIDIFTEKKLEDLCPAGHNMMFPFVKRTEYQIIDINEDSHEVSLLDGDKGETIDHLSLPDIVKGQGEATPDQKKLAEIGRAHV